jgi:hypothetical protein
MRPEDILNIMTIESGLNPAAGHPGGATGLVQFMPDTLKGLGYQGSADSFKNVAAVDQLTYVEKWMKSIISMNGGRNPKSVSQYYVGNFLPVALRLPGVQNEDPKTIIVAKHPTRPHLPGVSIKREMLFYNSNPYLDRDKDGAITYGDIQTVVREASKTSAFQGALADMRKSTGYTPTQRAQPQSMVAKNTLPDFSHKYPGNDNGGIPGVFKNLLDSFLKQIAASDKPNKKVYAKFLPENNMLIQIQSDSFNNSIEFSRILCAALDEELLSTAYIHTDGDDVEIECKIHGPTHECFEAVKQLSSSIAEAFKDATIKIGGVDIKTDVIMDKKSFYHPIDAKIAETQYRTFLLKFV